tara:strand:- start:431 stop:661 length:231 start_codon:yes stop_codon:yes gene_type:complete
MDYGENMPKIKSKLGNTIHKLVKLVVAIENKKGSQMNIDDHDYRWVKDRLEYMEKAGRQLNKEEMEISNKLWRQYG